MKVSRYIMYDCVDFFSSLLFFLANFFLRVRFDTTYFVENWKHCNKIIFKCVKNYCSLCFLLFISLKSLFMDNEQCQTRVQIINKKNKNKKT